MGWESCATLRAGSGSARPPHAREHRGRSSAAEPPVGGSLHLPVLLVPACPPRSGLCVGGVGWEVPVGVGVTLADVGGYCLRIL